MSTDGFFRPRLEAMIDRRHPLAVLAQRMPWDVIEQSLAPMLAHKHRIRPANTPGRICNPLICG